MPWRELLDTLNQRMGTGHIVQRQVVSQTLKIQSAGNLGMTKQGLQLRTKIDIGAATIHVQRLNPEAIPAQYQTPGGLPPERQGEHTPKPREAVHIPLKEGLKGHFSVTTCLKTMT